MKNETFTPERIKAEADAFFEWDGEDRSLVTTTSCLLFAQHIAGLMQARAAQPAPVVPEGPPSVLDEYERQTKLLPCQHEIPERGCSTYNWRMSVIRDLRAMLAAAGGRK